MVIDYSCPDEWATTKQACRDELVVYLFFSSIYTSLYFYVLSTVLRTSSFKLFYEHQVFLLPTSSFTHLWEARGGF